LSLGMKYIGIHDNFDRKTISITLMNKKLLKHTSLHIFTGDLTSVHTCWQSEDDERKF